jgi:hypothetical protein
MGSCKFALQVCRSLRATRRPFGFPAAHARLAPATVHRSPKLRTVRNASYCILGLNCGSEDSAQYRKLDSLVKPSISATAGVPYPTRNLMRRRMASPGRGVAGYRLISRFQHCSGMRSCRCRQPVRLIQRQKFSAQQENDHPQGSVLPGIRAEERAATACRSLPPGCLPLS